MASHSNCAPVQSELRIWIFASILNRTNYLECCKSVLDKSVARVCSTTVLLKWSVRMFRETARRGIMQTTVFSFVDASVDLTSFFNSGSWFQSCYFFLAFCLLPALNPVESWIWWWKGLSFLFVFFFPTSLCGVLVFRLDPAGAAFASPSAASSSSLPHHSLAHSLTHSLTHALTHSGAVQRASWLPFAWQAQYTEPPGRGRRRTQSLLEELRRARSPLGPRLPFAWQAQYTEPPGRGRRSTQSLLEELRRAWSPLGPRLPFSWQAQYTERLIITTHHRPTYHITTSHHHSSQLITPYHIPSHHSSTSHTSLITAPLLITTHHSSTSDRSTSHHNSSQLITTQLMTVPLLTPHFSQLTYHITTSYHNSSQLITTQLMTVPLLTPHFSHLTYHITTSYHNSSQLITSQLITAPLLTPLLTPHLTYHIRTHHSSTSHTWHHKSTSHTSLLTPPRSLH